MENKYLNEAIIGNKNILATYTQKGELQRLYFPSKDNKQYINFFHTGVRVNKSDLIYLHDDINNNYKQYYNSIRKSGRASISAGSTAFYLNSPQKISILYIRTVL